MGGDGGEAVSTNKYDVVFDVLGGRASYESAGKAVLRKGGRFITCVGPLEWIGDEILSMTEKLSWVGKILWYSFLNLIPGSHPTYSMVAPSDIGKSTFELAFENGVTPHVDKVVPFDDIKELREAIELVRSHRVRGKVVLEL